MRALPRALLLDLVTDRASSSSLLSGSSRAGFAEVEFRALLEAVEVRVGLVCFAGSGESVEEGLGME
jgi:hypothetical protein